MPQIFVIFTNKPDLGYRKVSEDSIKVVYENKNRDQELYYKDLDYFEIMNIIEHNDDKKNQ